MKTGIINGECKFKKIGYEKFEHFVNMIGGKWKLRILYFLAIKPDTTMRYGELKKALHSISHKMLSEQLKELEQDGIIIRTEYPQIPPKVEYSISEKGANLYEAFDGIMDWILKQEN